MREGVHFIRGKAAEVTDVAEGPDEQGRLVVVAEDTLLGVTRRVPVDMVVLSSGLKPRSDALNVAHVFSLGCTSGAASQENFEDAQTFAEIEGALPPKGAVLAPEKSLCETCPRNESKPERFAIGEFRRVATSTPDPTTCFLAEGAGVVEAPRGTLIHHYWTGPDGMITGVNLVVATNHNAAPIAMSVEKAAKGAIKGGVVDEGLLNVVEMAFGAYDPCHACATHSLPVRMPLEAHIHDHRGDLVEVIRGGE